MALQRHGVALDVVRSETQADQFAEHAARVHVAGHRLREGFEAASRALARKNTRAATLVAVRARGGPAREHLACHRTRPRGSRFTLDEPGDLAPADAGGRADAAHHPLRRGI